MMMIPIVTSTHAFTCGVSIIQNKYNDFWDNSRNKKYKQESQLIMQIS